MNPIVVKFGGSSLATAAQFEKVAAIIREAPARRYVVASAPGKRFDGDTKVTDLLYRCYDAACAGQEFAPVLDEIRQRFADIIGALRLSANLEPDFAAIEAHLRQSPQRDYMASRGEYLNSKLLAAYLGFRFVDAAQMVLFHADGSFDPEATNTAIGHALVSVEHAVIPGFYGTMPDGTVHTFSRGGSDVTGAMIANAIRASVYENWTDVDGFLTADPRVVKDPAIIDYLSYRELRELAYMGAEVLHPESIFPVRSVGIPINIKNTFNPSYKGTMIVAQKDLPGEQKVITGIAGKKGFTIVNIEKDMMNSEIGFGRKALSVLEFEGISFEHIPSGIDTLSIVIRDEYVAGKMQKVLARLQESLNADNIEIHSGLSLIATVGHNMAFRQGTASTLFTALARDNINVRMIDQGSSELNIIVGVDTYEYERAINSIYHSFV